MTSRDAAAVTLLSIACGGVVGCGSTGLLPVELVGSAAATPDAVAVDGVRYRVAVSDAWLFVAVENLTADTLRLDVDGLLFAGPDGSRHRLVPGDALARYRGSRERSAVSGESPVLGLRSSPTLAIGHRPAHVALRRLPPARHPALIAPGGSHADYFYPAEHLALAPSGEWSVGPLFCGRRPGEALAGLPFEVAVPFTDGRAIHTVLLDARVAENASAEGRPR